MAYQKDIIRFHPSTLILSSILFAVYYYRDTKSSSSNNDNTNNNNSNKEKSIPSILLSGVFLGLAIFTKIPAFAMIPLVGFLVYRNNNNDKKELRDHMLKLSYNGNLRTLGLWFIPVILIPLLWPGVLTVCRLVSLIIGWVVSYIREQRDMCAIRHCQMR